MLHRNILATYQRSLKQFLFDQSEEHLLFERLYDGVSDQIDTAAEKAIGVLGAEMDIVKHISMTSTFINKFYVEKDLVKRSLLAEKAFLSFSKQLYNDLKESGYFLSNKATAGNSLSALITSLG